MCLPGIRRCRRRSANNRGLLEPRRPPGGHLDLLAAVPPKRFAFGLRFRTDLPKVSAKYLSEVFSQQNLARPAGSTILVKPKVVV